MSETIFQHTQHGPYLQFAAIKVNDGGNGLPIHLFLQNGDPYESCSNSMSISQAKRFHSQLGKAIKAAEEAGIEDAGF